MRERLLCSNLCYSVATKHYLTDVGSNPAPGKSSFLFALFYPSPKAPSTFAFCYQAVAEHAEICTSISRGSTRSSWTGRHTLRESLRHHRSELDLRESIRHLSQKISDIAKSDVYEL